MPSHYEYNTLRIKQKNGKRTYWWAVTLLDSKGNLIREKGYNRFDRISKERYDAFLATGRFRKNKYLDTDTDDSGLGKLSLSEERVYPRMPVHPRLRTPITYYGGKQTLVKYILPLLPEHTLYCEPFFGGGAVFFAKAKVQTEVINDRNGEAINFYKVLQNHYAALQKEIKGTLHSRQLYFHALHVYQHPEKFTEVKRAWAFWTLTNQGFASMIGSWGFDNNNTKTDTVARKREAFSPDYVERLKTVQVENKDALEVMDRCDTPDTLFYCDPPYIDTHQAHYGGYTKEDYEKLLKKLAGIKGKFLLSSYPSPILRQYIKKYKWKTTQIRKAIAVTKRTHKIKTEMLVYNYPPTHKKEALEGLASEVAFLQRFVSFHQQTVPVKEIGRYLKDLDVLDVKAVTCKTELSHIRAKCKLLLAKVKTSTVRIEINAADLERYNQLITSASVHKTSPQKRKKVTVSVSIEKPSSPPGRMTAVELAGLKHTTLAFTGMWLSLFGELTEPFDMLIHGEPHAGKTTLLLKFAAYLAANFGKVMYVSSEEYPFPSLTMKVNELIHPIPKNLEFSGSLDTFSLKDFRFVFIDSVNDVRLDYEAYKKLQKDHPHVNFILVLQHTKDGQYRGSKEWEHKVAVGATIYEMGKIRVFRNRLANTYGNYDFLSEEPVNEGKAVEK